ncbi:hypothetical protein LXL04_012041 [Taraxacum kok-saghyz]
MSLLMSLGHYIKIWKLRGMAFDLFDAMIFLPIFSLLIAIVKRTWKFITLFNEFQFRPLAIALVKEE